MATTSFPVNHPQAVKHWSGDVFKQILTRTYASRFMGSGTGALCQVRNELSKDAGDRVRVGLRMQLTGTGIQGDQTLEGQEESLAIYHDDVTIDQLRHAVRSAGKMSEQRVPFSVRLEARDGLADWWADRMDYAFFNQLAGNTTQTDTRYTGNQSAIAPSSNETFAWAEQSTSQTTASTSTVDTMQVKLIDYCIERAKTNTLPLRPLRIMGSEYYVLFVSEEQATDMRQDYSAGGWGDIQKAAITGGQITKNPIFTGALGVYNDTVIHSTTRLPAGSKANTKRAVFCGAQAASIAFGKGFGPGQKYSWVESLFDYENELGVAAGCIFGLKKLQFDSTDFGVITFSTYAAGH